MFPECSNVKVENVPSMKKISQQKKVFFLKTLSAEKHFKTNNEFLIPSLHYDRRLSKRISFSDQSFNFFNS